MDKTSDYYGDGGRLASTPKDILINTAYAHDCGDADILLPGLHKADLAHAVMLIEEGIIPVEAGSKLIQGLVNLEKIPAGEFPVHPEYGDVYNSKDVALKQAIGDDAGWLHIGRPRREAVNIAYLIATRRRLLELTGRLSALIRSLIQLARDERTTIMPDFTYLHHAHPTSTGHYLLTFVYPMLRDAQRLKSVFSRLNQSPAGSGSVNGSELPLNRERLRQFLGFEGLIPHTRDAMWQTDVPLEAMSALVMTLMNINRIADELQIWNTAEFDMVDLPDDLCRASVIMPQKKNPYPLAYIRGVTASLLGRLDSFACYGRIATGNPDSRIFIYGELPRSLDSGCGVLDLMRVTFDGMKFNHDVMLERVQNDYSYSTDLADYIAMDHSVDYRTAHQVMGRVVREMYENGIPGNQLKADLLNRVFEEVTNKGLGISQNRLDQLISPAHIIQSRRTVGGAADVRMDEMFYECETQVAELNTWREDVSRSLNFDVLDIELEKYIGVCE